MTGIVRAALGRRGSRRVWVRAIILAIQSGDDEAAYHLARGLVRMCRAHHGADQLSLDGDTSGAT